MAKPKITEWCDVRYLNTSWKCPKGCPNEEGTYEADICDHGHVGCNEEMTFRCYQCEYEETFKLELKLKKV